MRRIVFGFFWVFLLVPGVVRAEDPVALALRVAEDAVIPGYDALAAATAEQVTVWQTMCAEKQGDGLARLRSAYQKVADGWAGVYFWQFGPIEGFLRKDRFYHWPERRNATAKGVGQLLANADPAVLEADRFAKTSVAAQGLPALERLLFGKDSVLNSDRACALGTAIAVNLDRIAQGTAADWRSEILPALKANQGHDYYFEAPEEVINRLVTDILTGFTIIKDQKLLPVMGPSLDKARPKKAEAWRSGRPLRNIRANVASLFKAAAVVGRDLPAEDLARLQTLQEAVLAALTTGDDLAAMVADPARRADLTAFLQSLDAYRASLIDSLTTHLGISVGFNSLDGD
ncbi:MAG: imelysin family protein [Magnetospiraceae bacterium]